MSKEPLKDGEISIIDAIHWQDSLKKDIDFDTPDDELTPDELAKKVIYLAMDEAIEKSVGSDMKKEIDESRKKADFLDHFQENVRKLTEVGKEIEKNFIWQKAYIANHFDKNDENHFFLVIRGMTDDLIKKDISDEERVLFAQKLLDIIKAYRGKVVGELVAKDQILSSLIPSLQKIFAETDFQMFDHEVAEDGSKAGEKMQLQFGEWLTLSNQLCSSRKKAIQALVDDLDLDEMVPKYVIQNDGNLSKNISGVEMKTKGERMLRLLNEANAQEDESEERRVGLSEKLFGKHETYIDFGKQSDSDDSSSNQISSAGMSMKMKWLIVIVLSIVALSGGIWTAIGVFILGAIIVGILSK